MSGNSEHLRRAVLVLVGPGAVKQRLITAYLEHLRVVDEDALPDAAGIEFSTLQSAFNCVRPAGGLCAAEVAVRKMSEQDAAAHAERIVALFQALSGARHETMTEAAAPPRLRVVGDEEDLPAFLSRA
jgi:hypothetical protein